MVQPKVLVLYMTILALLGVVGMQQHIIYIRGNLVKRCHTYAKYAVGMNHNCIEALSQCTATMSYAVPALNVWNERVQEGKEVPINLEELNIHQLAIGGGE